MVFHLLRGLEVVSVDEELQLSGGLRRLRRVRADYVGQVYEDNQRCNLQEIELVRKWVLRPH